MYSEFKDAMVRQTTKVSKYAAANLKGLAALKKIPISRLIAIALDNELLKENPFDFNIELPESGEYNDFAHAHECGLIIDFIKASRPTGLDILVLLRHDIGIPDKSTFLAAFKECIDNDVIEKFNPRRGGTTNIYKDGYYHWRLKSTMTPKKARKKASEYDKYLKLKKKFEREA